MRWRPFARIAIMIAILSILGEPYDVAAQAVQLDMAAKWTIWFLICAASGWYCNDIFNFLGILKEKQ